VKEKVGRERESLRERERERERVCEKERERAREIKRGNNQVDVKGLQHRFV
jgi:hypothetical protein